MSESAKTYVAATVGWVLGFAGPLPLAAAGIGYAAAHMGGEDWGLEWLLLIPVVVLNLVAFAPICCLVALRIVRSPLAGSVAVWSLLTGPAALVVGLLALGVLRVGGIVLLPLGPVLAVAIARARATRSNQMGAAG